MIYEMGADDEGKLQFVHARMIGDTGAYASVGMKVLERAAGHSCGPYAVPAVDVEARTVYTNNVPCGAFRGFGANQAAFGLETMMDLLAEKAGLDRYDIRERNVLDAGGEFATGQLMDESCGIRATLEAVKEDFKNAKFAGIACAIKNTGIGNGMPDIGRVLIQVEEGERITAYTGFTEMGQGLFTILQQVICEETGLSPDQIDVEVSTDFSVECGMTTASRATVLAGKAGQRAGQNLAAALKEKGLGERVGETFEGEYICDFTTKLGATNEAHPVTHLTFGYATQVVILDDEGKLEKVIAAHDVGKAINPRLCAGQVEGAVAMGLGYALTEDLPCENGAPFSTKLNDLGLLRAKHMPEIDVRLIEVPDKHGAYGAKGVGEIGLVPTAPAVASALHAFDNKRRFKLPMRDSPAAHAILPARLRE
jgi:xanthine dehydrogenase molybdenum-binding subunit